MAEKPDYGKCHLIWTSWWKKRISDNLRIQKQITETTTRDRVRIYNRIDHNYHLANKKWLFHNMKEYYRSQGRCVFKDKVFPVTFHIKDGTNDIEYQKLVQCFE